MYPFRVRIPGNDRAFNDMWADYNELWEEALSYFTHPLLRIIYVQQAPKRRIRYSYDTWHYFWLKQVIPVKCRQTMSEQVPRQYYQWWITRDMPFVLDTDLPPGVDHVNPAFMEYICRTFECQPIRAMLTGNKQHC